MRSSTIGSSGAESGTFSRFNRGVVTTYALEVGATGDGDNRDQSFSAFRAARCLIHEILRFLFPMAHWFHGGAEPNSPFSRNLPRRSLLGRYPSLGRRTLYNVPLNHVAAWASKCSLVLAHQRVRLNSKSSLAARRHRGAVAKNAPAP